MMLRLLIDFGGIGLGNGQEPSSDRFGQETDWGQERACQRHGPITPSSALPQNRKFLGSEAAGPSTVVRFTNLTGAKRHRLEPWAYLRDVLLRLSPGVTDLESLLP